MASCVYDVLQPSLDRSLKESPSDSSLELSLSLSDIFSLPDDDPEQAPAKPAQRRSGTPQDPRANVNAMPRNSFPVRALPTRSPSITLFAPLSRTFPVTASRAERLGFHNGARQPLSVLEALQNSEATNVHGWAPADPEHIILVDSLVLPPPVLPSRHISQLSGHIPDDVLWPDSSAGPWHSPILPPQWSYRPQQEYTLGVMQHVPSEAAQPTTTMPPFPAHVQPLPGSRLPSAQSMHRLAALTSMHRRINTTSKQPAAQDRRSSRASAPLPPVPTPSLCVPAPIAHPAAVPPTRTIPPAPRGGVAPALARSIKNIRLARERAAQGWARPAAGAREEGGERVPSVLRRWVSGDRRSSEERDQLVGGAALVM